MIEKVILASPRGFCAGVVRAIDIVKIALEVFPKPVYVRKEIVHNRHVVQELRSEGAVFVDSLEDVPEGKTVVFSAHGVSPAVRVEAQIRNLHVIDATCPLVTKVHLEAARYVRKGYTVLLIGHTGHDEVIGTMGVSETNISLVTCMEDVGKLDLSPEGKVAYITQTTLSLFDTEEIIRALKEKFPLIEGPPSADICYATQNRQIAVRDLAALSDLILVVGSRNSSNSNRLVEEALKRNTPSYLIDDHLDVCPEWFNGVRTVGVTSGASAPDSLVTALVNWLSRDGAKVEELVVQKENVQFALPQELEIAHLA
jgi:4-hydroxy-3-methylbut-2-enyl diphosphate reductase